MPFFSINSTSAQSLQIKIHWNDWNVLQFYLESISVIKQFDLQAQTSSVQEDMIAVFSLID